MIISSILEQGSNRSANLFKLVTQILSTVLTANFILMSVFSNSFIIMFILHQEAFKKVIYRKQIGLTVEKKPRYNISQRLDSKKLNPNR